MSSIPYVRTPSPSVATNSAARRLGNTLELLKSPSGVRPSGGGKPEVALVVGCNGISDTLSQLCCRLAQRGVHVFIAGDNEARGLSSSITACGGLATALALDEHDLTHSHMHRICNLCCNVGQLSFVLFNAAESATEEQLMASAITVGMHAADRMRDSRGSIFLTTAAASGTELVSDTDACDVSSCLRAVAQTLRSQVVGDIKISQVTMTKTDHHDAVVVAGSGGGESYMAAPEAVCETFLQLHDAPRDAWMSELDLR